MMLIKRHREAPSLRGRLAPHWRTPVWIPRRLLTPVNAIGDGWPLIDQSGNFVLRASGEFDVCSLCCAVEVTFSGVSLKSTCYNSGVDAKTIQLDDFNGTYLLPLTVRTLTSGTYEETFSYTGLRVKDYGIAAGLCDEPEVAVVESTELTVSVTVNNNLITQVRAGANHPTVISGTPTPLSGSALIFSAPPFPFTPFSFGASAGNDNSVTTAGTGGSATVSRA